MSLQRWFPTFVRMYRYWRDRFTRGGKALTLILLATLPALGAPDSPLLLLFGGALSLLVAVTAVNALHRIRLRAKKLVRACTTVDESVQVTVQLENQSQRVGYDLQMSCLPGNGVAAEVMGEFELLEPRETGPVVIQMTPSRRGAFPLPNLQASSSFPLNLVRSNWGVRLDGELVVYPRRARVVEVANRLSQHHSDGEHLAASMATGRSFDYEGSREYQPGIPVRRWDYSSWARTGQPVVREFGDEQHNSFAIAIDPTVSQLSAVEPVEEFEAMMSLTAGIAGWLLDNERRVGSLLLGANYQQGDSSLDSILDLLARAEPTTDDAFDALANNIESLVLGQNGVILITSRWDERRQRLCDRLNELRPLQCLVVGEQTISGGSGTQVSVDDIMQGRSLTL